MRRKKKVNVYEQVTERIITALESTQCSSWVKTWKGNNTKNISLPFNIVSKNNYRGSNMILTFCSQFSDPRWASYKQWKDNNCQVRRHQKSTKIIKWDTYVLNKGTKEEEVKWYIKTFSVFNAEQVEGELPEIVKPKEEDINLESLVDAYKSREKITFLYGGNRAFYAPKQDKIVLPMKHNFDSEKAFYSTVYHEMAHSTGHATRLNREGVINNTSFGSHEYSKEELIAEFTAAFLMAYTGREDDLSFKNSVAYLKSWSKKLKDNPTWAVSAAQSAQKAMDYILEKSQ